MRLARSRGVDEGSAVGVGGGEPTERKKEREREREWGETKRREERRDIGTARAARHHVRSSLFAKRTARGTFCPANSLSRSVTLFGRFCAGATAVR